MIEDIAALVGLPPDARHLEEALTHPSYANETQTTHYQRLEFLGDAVLGLCVSELLCKRFPDADEGTLTRMRASLVNADSLGDWARGSGIASAVLLGRGAEAGGLRDSTSVLADVTEALIAAAYLDGGLELARRFCAVIVGPELEGLEQRAVRDPKSELQERLQKRGEPAPVYDVIERGGPAHEPWFLVRVRLDDWVLAEGRGRSKRNAERHAAARALTVMSEGLARARPHGAAGPPSDGGGSAPSAEGERSTDDGETGGETG